MLKIVKRHYLIFVFTIIYSALLAWLFYRQACNLVVSDMPIYVLEIQGLNSLYSFPYPVFFKSVKLMSHIMGIPVAIASVLTTLNILSVYAIYRWIDKKFLNLYQAVKALAVMAIMLVSMLFWPLDISIQSEWWHFRYLGVFSPNVYQNATYLATRPFSILLFLSFIEIEEGQREIKNYALCGLWLLLGVLTKPSFAFVFLPVMAIATLYDIIKSKSIYPHAVKMLVTVLPACIALIYQFTSVFETSDPDGGIHIGLAVAWHVWTKGIKSAYVKANFFPLAYLILHFDDFKAKKPLRYAWYTHFVGMISFFALYEGGFRLNDANFAWGYMHGMFLVYMVSIVFLFHNMFTNKMKIKWRDWVSLMCLIPHMICGILFFVYMIGGGSASAF